MASDALSVILPTNTVVVGLDGFACYEINTLYTLIHLYKVSLIFKVAVQDPYTQ